MAGRNSFSTFSSSISIVLLILVVAGLVPFARSSRLCLQGGHETKPEAEDKGRAKTPGYQSYLVKNMGKGSSSASSLVTNEASKRQVPTGPDPIHHNSNPSTRP